MAAADTQEDLDALAGEFVLGTLDPQERADSVFRLRTDPDFKKAVESWGTRLAPLISRIEPLEPPPELEAKIIDRIAERRGAPEEPLSLQRQLRRWQRFSFAIAAVAAVLLFLLFRALPLQTGLLPEASRYVAALQADGSDPEFLIHVDLERGEATAQRVKAAPQAGKSFELWALGSPPDKPRSLGVLTEHLKFPVQALGAGGLDFRNITFAVSLEPEGGSPTGQPTGPVLFTGKLIAAN